MVSLHFIRNKLFKKNTINEKYFIKNIYYIILIKKPIKKKIKFENKNYKI